MIISPTTSKMRSPEEAAYIVEYNAISGSSGSPPPLDPSEDRSSVSYDVNANLDDLEGDDRNGDITGSVQRKKQRKKVTFDLPPRRERRAGWC